MLSFAAITPHPPIIVPTIGSEEDIKKAKGTIEAMENLRIEFEKKNPETLFLVSPHAPIDFHELTIITNEKLSGNFLMFGDFGTSLEFENDKNSIEEIKKNLEKENINYRLIEEELDHGILVPLFYLLKNKKSKIVPLAYSMLDAKTNFKYGKILGKMIEKSPKKIGFIASGDLSHRLTPSAPAGYSSRGKLFDEKLINLLKNNDVNKFLEIDSSLTEEAGECGYRSIAILLGALSVLKNKNLKFNILSYEGPFGVGYLVANVEDLTGS
jgi:aromatic ring-opening dioxygenase LigB subunit